MRAVAKDSILRIVRNARELAPAEALAEALKRAALDSIELAPAKPQELVRTYTIRLTSLEDRGIERGGAEDAIRRLKTVQDDEVWVFTFRDPLYAYVGIADSMVETLVAALVLPRLPQHRDAENTG